MISMLIFLLVLGLLVFGPKKTIEMAQSVGHSVAKLKQSVAGSELGSLMNPEPEVSNRIEAILAQHAKNIIDPSLNPDRSRSTGSA